LVILSSCSPSPEKLILGKWRFDRIDTGVRDSGSDLEDQMAEMMNALLGTEYANMTMQFYSNGECIIYRNMFSNQSARPYRIIDHGKTLVTTDEFGAEEQIQIIRIDEKELAIVDQGATLVLVRE
jgi:hypothetical protein